MLSTSSPVRTRPSRTLHVLRGWWPVAGFVATALVAQHLLLASRYDVGGHAAEHLQGASAPFMALAMVAIVFWSTPRARREWGVIAAAAAWWFTTLLVMVGNVRVVDDLIATGSARTPTSAIPDVADHSLANAAPWYAVVAALLLIAALRQRGHLGNRGCVAAVAVTLVVPPWFIPGAGVIVAAVVCAVHLDRDSALPHPFVSRPDHDDS